MKQLLIIRHAKSSWAISGQDDFDRPLNDRGMRDAPAMAQRILGKGVQIEAFISSPALRALTTANFFAEAYHGELKIVNRLYQATAPVFYDVATAIEDKINTAAIFSHNPGITAFANDLTATRIDDMPTCGVFAVRADIDHWKDFRTAAKTFWFFDYPKA